MSKKKEEHPPPRARRRGALGLCLDCRSRYGRALATGTEWAGLCLIRHHHHRQIKVNTRCVCAQNLFKYTEIGTHRAARRVPSFPSPVSFLRSGNGQVWLGRCARGVRRAARPRPGLAGCLVNKARQCRSHPKRSAAPRTPDRRAVAASSRRRTHTPDVQPGMTWKKWQTSSESITPTLVVHTAHASGRRKPCGGGRTSSPPSTTVSSSAAVGVGVPTGAAAASGSTSSSLPAAAQLRV